MSIHLTENNNKSKDVVPKKENSLEESKFENIWNIIDIKQITNKLSAEKILKNKLRTWNNKSLWNESN